ncbi:MAG: AAA family ATPase [Halobacteriales archaeon]
MPVEASVLGRADDADRVRLDARTMAELDVSPGDPVEVSGDGRTVARTGGPLDGESGLRAGREVLRAAGLAPGDSAVVSATVVPPAASVTLAPPPSFRFEGVTDAVRESLVGRRVARGTAVRPSLFGGALEVRFVVVDVAPTEPATVTDATDVVVRDAPVGPSDRPGGADRTFDDVGGLDDAVAAVRRLVAFPLERPDAYRRLAGGPPDGVLLKGPSGSGKTLLVDALGNEIDARYVRVPHAGAVEDRYENGFDDLAVEAARDAPAVVLLDDVDEIAPTARGASGGYAAEIGAFFEAVAGEDVVVVGTTADPDGVASSLRRGGRFEHEIDLPALDRNARREVLTVHVRDVALSPAVDLDAVAAPTHGFVAADLKALVSAAVDRAAGRLVDATDGEPAVSVRPADFEAALDSVAPGGMRGLRIERPEVTYRDVGGLENAKLELVRAVEWPLRYPELLERVATTAPTGILLHGLPGTGKTMLARAVANATDANFIAVEGPELLDRYVGESERGVRQVFERADRNAPSVLFFDEVDALAPERGGDSDAEVTERVVSQLLTELDGVEPREGVVVIGATNRPDVIDPALLRPGRLERVVEVAMPERAAREEIFRTHARDVPTEGVDFEALAAATDGYSGSDIEAAVREAGLLAVEGHLRNRSEGAAVAPESITVRQAHFERALESVEPSVSLEMRQRYADLVENMPHS